jgi:hypothetical protein
LSQKNKKKPGAVAHGCNCSYLEGRDEEVDTNRTAV